MKDRKTQGLLHLAPVMDCTIVLYQLQKRFFVLIGYNWPHADMT